MELSPYRETGLANFSGSNPWGIVQTKESQDQPAPGSFQFYTQTLCNESTADYCSSLESSLWGFSLLISLIFNFSLYLWVSWGIIGSQLGNEWRVRKISMLSGIVEKVNVGQRIWCMSDNKEVEGGKVDWAMVRKSLVSHPQVQTLIFRQAIVSYQKWLCKSIICFSQAF